MVWVLSFGGQVLLALGVFSRYGVLSRRLGAQASKLRNLGAQATTFVPIVTTIPMIPVVLWQALNVGIPRAQALSMVKLPWLNLRGVFLEIDIVQLAGFLALAIAATVAAIVLYRSNRSAIRQAWPALGGVQRR